MNGRIGPGALILVVGPSGAGKDTVIAAARPFLRDRPDIQVARRLVTRPPGAGEDHGTLSREAFDARKPGFALWWDAHGLSYALGEDVAQALRAGGVVIANGSRAALPIARARFDRLGVVHITAPAAIRARRLAARGRESEADILHRLARAPALDTAPDLEIENTGAPETAGDLLARFARGF